jgi:polyhydroxyalkanoate synthesis regulator phasin
MVGGTEPEGYERAKRLFQPNRDDPQETIRSFSDIPNTWYPLKVSFKLFIPGRVKVNEKTPWHFALICLIFADTVQFVEALVKNPHKVLKGVTMKTLLEKGFLAGIGLLSMTREKAEKIIDELSHEGELQKGEMKQWVDKLSDRGEEERQALRKLIRDELKKVLDDMGLATKEDIQKLLEK